eukprot:jgi/Mesen1/5595/ME000282S04748
MQYSPLRSSDSLCCAEEGRHDISSGESHDQLRRRQKPWILLIALSAIVFFMAGAGMFGPGLLSLERRILLRLSIQLPPPPGNATKMYKPEKCIPTKVPVPRVEDMTLDEKLGQMTQVDQLAVGSGEDITNYFIGSVLSGGGGAPAWGNSAEAWADLVDNMAAKASKTRLRIPMLYGVDAVHGHNNVDGATIFPHHVGLGATRNPGLVKKIAAAAAKEVAATGIRWAFAPTIAVCRDPRWGRCYESFSEETDLVRNLTSEIDGWQTAATSPGDPASMVPGEYLVAATAKHFVGDGGTYGGKDEGDTRVSEAELREVHLPPFRDAVRRGVLTTMISYSSWNGLKMHANGYLITDVLKGELGFKGVVVSDWAAIQQIPCNWACQIRTAINAGLDMIMVPTTYQAFIGALRSEVLQGNVAMDRIDDAVRRVLRLKVQLGLFENACAQRSLIPEIGSGPHRELARKAARETLTAATSPGDPASMVPGEYLVAATAKHFVGDGGTYGGKDEGDTRVSEAELREVHLPPFRDAVRRGVLTTMISYSSWNGLKMHANGYLITDVLKGELGFKGVVVSDWAAIQQIPCNWACQIRTAINAGLDMIMVPTTYQAFIGALRSEVLQGNVAMDRIDDAVRRVLRLKVQLGLFENACAQRSLIPEIGSGPHRELARKAARETLVLLKNERRPESAVPGSAGAGSSMFPLPLDGARVLVAGSHADDVGKQCGGWTIKWQGGVGNITNGTTVLQGVQRAAAGRAHVQYVEQPTGEESADYGIVVVGELPYTEYYGDNQNLQLSARSQAAVTAVCGRMPCVVVLISGRVMEVDHLVAGMDAFVAAWLPGSEAGQGIADALFSPQFDFVGRLPFTWFPDPATNRISANKLEESTPLFPFGFGLNKLGQALPSL